MTVQGLVDDNQISSFEIWYTEKANLCPQFQFWSMIRQLELYVMIFIALREGDFHLDQINYAIGGYQELGDMAGH